MRSSIVVVMAGVMTCLSGVSVAQQQFPQAMGVVATRDAEVTGGLQVNGGEAQLIDNTSITAKEQTAEVKLQRGGTAMVCATSQLHLLHSGGGTGLLFGLDRGAMELHTTAQARDVILTPDIRFTVEQRGSFNLSLRVTRSGDTCVDNAGAKAPVLMLNDAFSQASYRVMPGQHVLFEHGNLREVVDHERSPCGCPAVQAPQQLGANATAAQRASAAHPFPAAASEGLNGEQAPVANSPVGEKQTQISTTFAYGEGQGAPPSTVSDGAQADGAVQGATPLRKRSFGAKLKHFFYRIFHPAG